MSLHALNSILPVCAALVAAWTVMRFPQLRPTSLAVSGLHVAVAWLGGLTAAGYLMRFIFALSFPGAFELAVILGGLVPLVYFFVSVVWLVRNLNSRPKPPGGRLVRSMH
ncbi:MAG: hypothetical protein ACRDM1_01525 [Gaiellaceae bacterium]